MASRINHIAIAVRATSAALHLYTDVLGLKAHPTTRHDAEGVLVTFVDAEGARLEVLEPVEADSPVGRFLEKRGEGIHHICLEVDDLAAASAELAAQGYNLIDPTPRRNPEGELYVFLHPNSTSGALIELYQARAPRPSPGGQDGSAEERPGGS